MKIIILNAHTYTLIIIYFYFFNYYFNLFCLPGQ